MDQDGSKACQVLKFNMDVTSADFPSDFLWGNATSAYQIEGAAHEGGRGPSVWDMFSLRYPNKIVDGSNGNTACNAYYKTKEDVQMMKKLGIKAYRFSFSWSRLLPGGKISLGINQEAVDYYNNLINELLANGIEPFVTLWHADTPNALEEEYMGFLSEHIVCDYMHYAEFCFWEFGDRVKNWITLNEPYIKCIGGYVWGTYAPGRGGTEQENTRLLKAGCNLLAARVDASRTLTNSAGNPGTEPYIVSHNMVLCHATAVKLYREKFQETQKGKIGITLVGEFLEPLDPTSQDDIDAVRRVWDFSLGWFMEPITKGQYPESMRRIVGPRLPQFTAEQAELVKGSFDFIGLNYYATQYGTNAPDTGVISYLNDVRIHQQPEDLNGKPIGPQGGPAWLWVYPEGLYKYLMNARKLYGDLDFYITENGYGELANDHLTLAQARVDVERVQYHHDHLLKLKDAIRDGVNVKGYFAWSLMDNFEWVEGYTIRFGMHYVDFKNGKFTRYPKQSALWYMDFLRPRKGIATIETLKRPAITEASEALKKTKIRTT